MRNSMSCGEAFLLLNRARMRLNDVYGDIVLDSNMSVLEGDAAPNGDRYLFRVGVREFVENPDKVLPMGAAMNPIVGLFHEVYGHGGQFCDEFHAYYGFDLNRRPTDAYFRQPHEIAAQYAGIRAARDWLAGEFGAKGANDMIFVPI